VIGLWVVGLTSAENLPRSQNPDSSQTQQTPGSAPAAFRLGPESPVSVNADGGALRCEPSVAIAGRDIVAAWNDSWGGAHGSPTGVAIGWSLSRDAGQTFRFGGYLPEISSGRVPSGADSQIVTDEQGNFYLEVLTWQQASQAILIYFMNHQAIGSWQRVTTAVSVDSRTGAFLDRPSLRWDPDGHLDLSYTAGKPGAQTIAFATSIDRGRTFADPMTVSATASGARGGSAVAGNGREVIVAWMEGDGVKQPSEGWYVHSADAGKSFSAPGVLYRLVTSIGTVPGYVMGFSPDAHTGLGHYVSVVASGLRHVAAICNHPQPAPTKSLEIRRIQNPADDS
jgi:hypothetical protein